MSILASLGTQANGVASNGITQPFNRALGYLVNSALPITVPPLADAYDAFRRGQITGDDLKLLAGALGIMTRGWQTGLPEEPLSLNPQRLVRGSKAWASMLDARVNQVGITELLALHLRGNYSEEQLRERAKAQGWWRGDYLDEAIYLAKNRIPDAADLVRFALRDCWDAQAVRDFGYDLEFPDPFRDWMLAQGAGGSALTRTQRAQGDRDVNWAQMYWRAHWNTLSPTQCYEMFQRLRPGRVKRFEDAIPGIKPFVWGDLETQLRINDYPKPTRPWLAAIAYRRPRLVDIDRWVRTKAILGPEAYDLHLDLGYAPVDARRRTDWLLSQQQTISRPADVKAAVKAVVAMYVEGEYTRQQALDYAVNYLSQGQYADMRAATAALNADAGARALWQGAVAAVGTADMRRQLSLAKALTTAWRKRYLRGQFTRADIANDMLRAGRTREWVELTLDLWDAELAGGKLLASTANIKKWVRAYIITMDQARQYLHNLGWRGDELENHLKDAATKLGRGFVPQPYLPPPAQGSRPVSEGEITYPPDVQPQPPPFSEPPPTQGT
jgi:hypothetical protein